MRLFVGDDSWSEVTSGGPGQTAPGVQPVVRLSATDLQQAQRARARLRGQSHGDETVAVILDIKVAVAGDVRSAYASLGDDAAGVRYAGTVEGLAGLLADLESADVADGVTLIPVAPQQDLRELAQDVLLRLQARQQAC